MFTRKLTFLIMLCFYIANLYSQTFTPYPYQSEVEANRTVTYHQAISLWKAMAAADDRIRVNEVGITDVGLPLHEVIVDFSRDFTPEGARKQGKAIVFINNGIHPGEPDGIDATLWMVQDILTGKLNPQWMEKAVLVIVPVYNVDGALIRSKTLRASQNGPETYGFRGNGQYLDLNRDFIKCDSKNAMSFVQLYRKWNADILIDNHVSNGADYEYVMTMLPTQMDKLGYQQTTFMRNNMMPALYKAMEKRSFPMCPYVNVWGTTPDKGLPGFTDTPRYCSGYAALFQSFAFVPETHMLKPYHLRVKSTYAFMESVLEYLHTQAPLVLSIRKNSIQQMMEQASLPIVWKEDRSKADTVQFKGYEYEYVTSKVSGLPRLKYFRDRPVTWNLPYYSYAQAIKTVKVPAYYVVPQAYHRVIERLAANGVQMYRIANDTTLYGEMYRITQVGNPSNPYESHFAHHSVQTQVENMFYDYWKGDYIIPTNQATRRFIVEVLEPEATDSYFVWNFFDGILNRKEGFSDYVFEDEAAEILNANPQLKADLEKAKQADEKLASSAFAQLNYIYQRSKYGEPYANLYPVMRIMEP